MTGSHDPWLVCLSIVIAVFSSYTALDLAGRARTTPSGQGGLWMGLAALALGGGIWAMHFVAMMAYSMPGMTVAYDLAGTLLSLLVAVFATYVGFSIAGRGRMSRSLLLGSGTFMGLGVVSMHYIGMSAMRMQGSMVCDPLWVAVSVVVAVVAATAALWLSSLVPGGAGRVAAAVTMGAAIAGMHYSAMQGVSFSMGGGPSVAGGMDQRLLALGVTIASLAVLFMALAMSVVDRRLAEASDREAAALRISRERAEALYRGTPLPLHSLDRQGRIEQVSDTWLEMSGYSRDEVVGRLLTEFMVEDADGGSVQEDVAATMRHGFIRDAEHGFVTRSGEVRNVLMSARVDRDARGAFLGILGGLVDVTERRRTEEALRQVQKLEAIGQLTGGVAHDFNNLLAVVVGNLDLVRRRVKEDPKALRLVENALEGANRGSSLTQRLLAFARRQDLKPAAVDVAGLVAGMSDLLQRSIGPMVRIETRFTLGLPAARVDAHQLEMAILNLAVNARDAMPEGGTLLIAASASPGGAGQGLEEGQYVRIEVSDDGIGMDAATLARASEPFFTTKGVGKGTGLGVPMVQGLAAQSGGRLFIRSALGEGTTIELWLPVAVESSPGAQREAAAPEGPARIASILVVDDDHLVLQNTVAMLEDLGHQVSAASSALDALDMLPDLPRLDLVVTDHLMPGMTGLQLVERLAAARPYMPVLLVSGYCDVAGDRGLSLPMLAKPFDQAALDQAVRRALAGGTVIDLDTRRGGRRLSG